MIKGFKNFLLRGDVITVAVGLVVALAFSMLITAFTNFIINPIVARFAGSHSVGLGVQLSKGGNHATFVDFGQFISAVIYFVIFMAIVYFLIVVPYKKIMARRGATVFGDPATMKTCPACLQPDIPVKATRCKYCTTEFDEQPTSA